MKVSHKQTPKQNQVVEQLRKGILDGTLKPQTQLPPQAKLARQFKVSGVTANLAIARLAREGFVYSRKCHGTFVAAKPPHLTNYALVFPSDPGALAGTQWSRYYMALTNEAIGIQQRDGRRMLLFHGIDHHADSEDRQRLLAHIESRQLAGIIFANLPLFLEGTPILEQAGIPRVAIMSKQVYPNVPAVAFDYVQWFQKAFDYLAAQGRRRIAVIMIGIYRSTDEILSELAAERGLTVLPYWRHVLSVQNLHEAGNLVHLLMYGGAATRPDGLIISDDNIVEHSLAGLVAAGVRVPDDVAVVAHCSFPWPPPSVLPVKRLGYDIGHGLRTCIEVLDRQRRGEPVPPETRLPALFEEEYQAAAVEVRQP